MKTLLIVEDMPDIIFYRSTVIDKTQWKTSVVLNFSDAEQLIRTTNFDLVITDFNFPGGDGNDVAELVRKNNGRVILHTGAPENTEIKRDLFENCYSKLDRSLITLLRGAA